MLFSAINNKSVSNVGVTVDDSNNLTVTVAQTDGTSKSGSVILPAGGEVETEVYGIVGRSDFSFNDIAVVSSNTDTRRATDMTWYILKANADTEDSDGLYYDSTTDVFKRCKTKTSAIGSSGTSRTSSWQSLTIDPSCFSFLIGLPVSGSGSSTTWYLMLGTTYVVRVNVSISNNVVTGVTSVHNTIYRTGGASNTTSGINATYTVKFVYQSGSAPTIYPISSRNSIPSNYVKIADL